MSFASVCYSDPVNGHVHKSGKTAMLKSCAQGVVVQFLAEDIPFKVDDL